MILGSYYLTMVRIGSSEKGAERLAVDDPGDTEFAAGQIVDGDALYAANHALETTDGRKATYKPLLAYRDSSEALMAYANGDVGLHAPHPPAGHQDCGWHGTPGHDRHHCGPYHLQ